MRARMCVRTQTHNTERNTGINEQKSDCCCNMLLQQSQDIYKRASLWQAFMPQSPQRSLVPFSQYLPRFSSV